MILLKLHHPTQASIDGESSSSSGWILEPVPGSTWGRSNIPLKAVGSAVSREHFKIESVAADEASLTIVHRGQHPGSVNSKEGEEGAVVVHRDDRFNLHVGDVYHFMQGWELIYFEAVSSSIIITGGDHDGGEVVAMGNNNNHSEQKQPLPPSPLPAAAIPRKSGNDDDGSIANHHQASSSSAVIVDRSMVPVDIFSYIDKKDFIHLSEKEKQGGEEEVRRLCNKRPAEKEEDGHDDIKRGSGATSDEGGVSFGAAALLRGKSSSIMGDDIIIHAGEVRFNTVNTGAAKRIVDKVFFKVHHDPSRPSIHPTLAGSIFVVEREEVGEVAAVSSVDDTPPKKRKFRIVPLLKRMDEKRTKIMADMEAEHESFVSKTKSHWDYVAERVRILGEKGKEPPAAAVEVPVVGEAGPSSSSSTGKKKGGGGRVIKPTIIKMD